MISLSVSLIWLLAMLGAAAHLRDSDRTAVNALWVGAIFAVTMLLANWLSPQPNWIGVLIGIAAMWRLIAGPQPRAALAVAGASGGMAGALAMAGGIPAVPAAGVTLAALLAAVLLREKRRASGFRQEALLIPVALAAPLIGLAGDLVFGWHSASMLSGEAGALDAASPPDWAIAIVGAALLAGLVRGIWIKR